ncbi:MAG: radical SAM family heme chaperone HemW [Spirochaetia bacterium]|nr:radical SAM family heme chaperone HemW [Spirochaetia bacterium]
MKSNTGLYVHIPYCVKKCSYCDFVSFPVDKITKDSQQEYLKHLLRDLEYKKLNYFQYNINLKSIFFGGGTPSLFSPDFYYVFLQEVKAIFNLKTLSDIEISMEANPESLYEQAKKLNFSLKEYKQAGINRLSIGVQSLNEKLLKYLGRLYIHKNSLEKVFDNTAAAGFTNINVDLIYGIAGQTFQDIEQSLSYVLGKNITHLSFYELTVEKKTPLYKETINRKKPQASNKRALLHHNYFLPILEKAKFERYEVSNYCLSGFECRHNMIYWSYNSYIGIGLSAHSFNGKIRIKNADNIKKYEKELTEEISEAQYNPELFIGFFRLLRPVFFKEITEFLTIKEKSIFLKVLKTFQERLWLNLSDNNFSITKEGILFSDSMVFEMSEALSASTNKTRS